MPHLLPVPALLAAPPGPLLDVRSPGEYAQGHVPGAVSFPMFDDAERAAVGTCYKHLGRDAAVLLGLGMVGPKLATWAARARALAPHKALAVHCWRGGMRSGSMAWLLETAGLEVHVMEGGYKAYRREVLADLAAPRNFRVLGGKTGSGKTQVLQALAQRGQQVLDLELLASHRGSSFGMLMQAPQPTSEQFENNLHAALQALDPGRPIWVEDESRNIGQCFVPIEMWKQMQAAPAIVIEVPPEDRVAHLVAEYATAPVPDLVEATARLQKRLGGVDTKLAIQAIEAQRFDDAVRILLRYYDRTYAHSAAARTGSARTLAWPRLDAGAIAEALLHAPPGG